MKKLIVIFSLLLAPLVGTASPVEVLNLNEPSYNQDQYRNYNFGGVYLGTGRFVDFVLTANSPEAAQIRGWSLHGPWYFANTNCPYYLQPGRSCVFRVFYEPRQFGTHRGQLTIQVGLSYVYIHLYGRGI